MIDGLEMANLAWTTPVYNTECMDKMCADFHFWLPNFWNVSSQANGRKLVYRIVSDFICTLLLFYLLPFLLLGLQDIL